MMIIGCDLHTRYQQIAMLDTETGEEVERRLEHESGEARTFYSSLKGRVRVGIEATGHTHWGLAHLCVFCKGGVREDQRSHCFPIPARTPRRLAECHAAPAPP
jgi:hypothetical protein